MSSVKQDFETIRKRVEEALNKNEEPEEIAWTVVEGVSAIIDGATGTVFASLSSGALKSIRDGVGLAESLDSTPNPYFVFNGHADDPDTTYTHKYMRNRGIKGIVGGIFGLVGTGSSQVTQVDVAGILMHSNAVASTSIHLIKLKSLGAGYKQSQTLMGWIDLLIKMKAMKAGVRGAQLAGAAIPVGAVGLAAGAVAAIAKLGIILSHTKLCAMTAAQIHWRAYQEQAISGGLVGKTGKIGPASNMMYEMFCRRGATRIFGKYDVDRMIKEPTGWLCLNDKLMLV